MDTIDEKVLSLHKEQLAEKLGYLIAKVEEFSTDSKATAVRLEALEKRVDEKFQTAETTLRVLGWVASGLVAIVTVPWTSFTLFVKRLFV